MNRFVDPREAEEVVRLAAMRQNAPQTEGPTVEELAHALSLPVSEVERLLAQVRRREVVMPKSSFGDRSAALSAALVLALVVVVGLVAGGIFVATRPKEPAVVEMGPVIPAVPGVPDLPVTVDVPEPANEELPWKLKPLQSQAEAQRAAEAAQEAAKVAESAAEDASRATIATG